MAAPASAKSLTTQLPNSNTPLCQISGTGESLGLKDSEGNPLSGNFSLQGFITPAWLYLLGALLSTGSTTAAASIRKGSFTLVANATQTVVLGNQFFSTSIVFWTPTTPDAANDMATTSAVAAVGKLTITHANNARTDRTFNYICVN